MEEFLFHCEVCGNEFEPNPECMIPVEIAGYLTTDDKVEVLSEDSLGWEGTADFRFGKITDYIHVITGVPPEFANNAICVCPSCLEQFG